MSATLAAVFPGQGSQRVGMGRALYDASAAARHVLDRADATLPGLLELMWDGPAEALQATENQQPALVAAGLAAYAAYREAGGVTPRYAAGHSLGEYTAHVAAGSLDLADALRLVRRRGGYMQEAAPVGEGAMAAVLKSDVDTITRVLAEIGPTVEVANLNAPGQTVISGTREAVAAAGVRLKELGARVIMLKVSAPFHCNLMRPAALRLASDLHATTFDEPEFGIVCNVTADLLPSARAAADLLVRQVTAPVRWTESVETLVELGVDRFLEFGSGSVLAGLIERIVPGVAIASITDPDSLASALLATR